MTLAFYYLLKATLTEPGSQASADGDGDLTDVESTTDTFNKMMACEDPGPMSESGDGSRKHQIGYSDFRLIKVLGKGSFGKVK